jgi:hypothetical protein
VDADYRGPQAWRPAGTARIAPLVPQASRSLLARQHSTHARESGSLAHQGRLYVVPAAGKVRAMTPFAKQCSPEGMLDAIARTLVDYPESVRVEVSGSPNTAVYILHVDQSDIGKIIGRGGRTINIIRDLLVPIAARIEKRVIFDVYNGQPRRVAPVPSGAPIKSAKA